MASRAHLRLTSRSTDPIAVRRSPACRRRCSEPGGLRESQPGTAPPPGPASVSFASVAPHELLRPPTAADSIDAPARRFVPSSFGPQVGPHLRPLGCDPDAEADTARPATIVAGLAVERPAHRAVRRRAIRPPHQTVGNLKRDHGSLRGPIARPLAPQPRQGEARE